MEAFTTDPEHMSYSCADRSVRFVRTQPSEDLQFHAALLRLGIHIPLPEGTRWLRLSFSWFRQLQGQGPTPAAIEAFLEHGPEDARDLRAQCHFISLSEPWGRESLIFDLTGDEIAPLVGIRFSDPHISLLTLSDVELSTHDGPTAPGSKELEALYAPFVENGWYPEPFMETLHDVVKLYYTPVLRDSGDAMDIGANKGFHTLGMLDAVGQSKQRVMAVEPHPTLYDELVSRFAQDDNVSIVKTLVGARDSMDVAFAYSETHHELGSARPNYIDEFFPTIEDDFQTIRMDMSSVDTLVTSAGLSPSFIKIDVEGLELEVLHGSLGTLEKFRPVIAFEFNVASSRNNSYLLSDIFEHFDYVVFDCFGNRLDATTWCNPRIAPIDRVAVPAEKADHLMESVRGQLDAHWTEWRTENLTQPMLTEG